MNKPNESCYTLYPRVALCGRDTEFAIRPVGRDAAFSDDTAYELILVPREYGMPGEDHLISEWMVFDVKNYPTFRMTPTDGSLFFNYSFSLEQEWTVCVRIEGDKREILSFPIYAVKEDLYLRTPYIGDCHVHSSRSDGHESPGVVAANYRKAGFDFMALTDHRRYWPSEEMCEQYKNAPIDIKLFHGEEVHDRTARVHIVNFGGRESINLKLKADEEALERRFADDGKRLKSELALPETLNPTEFAARKWIFEQIHACGGFAIFAHPCWKIQSHENNVSIDMTEAILKAGYYDAMEIVTGQALDENNLQTHIYHEMRTQGLQIPIVGDSDSHGTEPSDHFGEVKTMVLAPDCEFDSLCRSIRELYSVAVQYHTTGQAQMYGPLRLVRFCSFLFKYYLPHHNDLCFEEGLQMRAFLQGAPEAEDALARLSGRTKAYAELFYGRNT